MPPGAFRAHSGNPFGGAGGRFARAPPRLAEWLAQGRRAVAQARSLSHVVARRFPGVSKNLVLLECTCLSGDSRERAFTGTGGRVASPAAHPALFLTLGDSRISLEPTANIAAKPGGDATTNLLF